MKLFYLLSLSSICVESIRLHIVGISSGLGRELAFQALTEYEDIYVTGMCSKPEIQALRFPYRNGGLEDKGKEVYFFDKKRLCLFSYDVEKFVKSGRNMYDSLVFTTSGSAFEKTDYSDVLTEHMTNRVSDFCDYIQCVSAYGVEDNWGTRIEKGIFEKIGIQGMKDFYLREVYRSKKNQERILKDFSDRDGIEVEIFRPKVLSFGNGEICATSREELARSMLQKIVDKM